MTAVRCGERGYRMMLDKRLTGAVPQTKPLIAAIVAVRWASLLVNIWMAFSIAALVQTVVEQGDLHRALAWTAVSMAAAACGRFADSLAGSLISYRVSRQVKSTLRDRVIGKLLRLGPRYRDVAPTSEVVQVATEGVEQLETYFAQYLPQLFYSLLAPLTLFAFLAPVSMPAAVALLVCVPLIPASIVAVQRWAKRLLARYWGQYTELGDTFLENLQGLTTLKVYRADESKQLEMNEQAEQFRKVTMRVLIMQLNSISIMDLVAYGGAAIGCILALLALRDQAVDIAGAVTIVLLAAEFFLPMRLLGSYFHIAMNGMAASEKLFRILDAPEVEVPRCEGRETPLSSACGLKLAGVTFSYEPGRAVLKGVDLEAPLSSLTAIVGPSGGGKSTIAAVATGRAIPQEGEVLIAGIPLSSMSGVEAFRLVTYVGHQSYLFAGTVRENLLMARPDATDEDLWDALRRVRIADYFASGQGLDTKLTERGENLSGGQRQRLAIARAILHDTPCYIFDEATSNIDVESEDAITAAIHELAREKAVVVIAHRLANVVDAARIFVVRDGSVVESGTHDELLARAGTYAELWRAQRDLEYLGVDDMDKEA